MTDPGTMSADQFNRAVKKLGLTTYSCGDHLGISLSASHRYARGEVPVPKTLAKLIRAYLKFGLPGDWK